MSFQLDLEHLINLVVCQFFGNDLFILVKQVQRGEGLYIIQLRITGYAPVDPGFVFGFGIVNMYPVAQFFIPDKIQPVVFTAICFFGNGI